MQLRSATINDAGMLCRFASQAFYDSYAWYNDEQDMAYYVSNSFSVTQLEVELSNPTSIYLLAIEHDELCGYIKLAWNNRPDIPNTNEEHLEIARLYADKKLIGKGVGKLMIEAAITLAKDNDTNLIWLDVWKENKRAIEFYKKWGFAIVSNWTFVLGKDKQEDYIMVKKL